MKKLFDNAGNINSADLKEALTKIVKYATMIEEKVADKPELNEAELDKFAEEFLVPKDGWENIDADDMLQDNKNYTAHFNIDVLKAEQRFAIVSGKNEKHAEEIILQEYPYAKQITVMLLKEIPNYSGIRVCVKNS